ncbi:hypothetical protein [Enterobacillus tribolii]|uniref:Uncharacterized protein n=1 Tax=Enterobacillus tribolii TaxID=1487935 RepID=A0A370R0U9_9GAMM|nr:hypothetical protein [Enterobacillus tribolii]MBW7982895.1 hypothetical protein [Enterobacillus tribolii]RDK95544.1 hypothetical protein C8D90_10215 [Enterobacillus tribolii]
MADKLYVSATVERVIKASDGSTLRRGDVAYDEPLILKGGSQPNTKVFVYDNGKLIGTVTTDQYGDWSLPVSNLTASHAAQGIPCDMHKFTAMPEASSTIIPVKAGSYDLLLIEKYQAPSQASDVVTEITETVSLVGEHEDSLNLAATSHDSDPVSPPQAISFSEVLTTGETTLAFAPTEMQQEETVEIAGNNAEMIADVTPFAYACDVSALLVEDVQLQLAS